MRSGFSVKYCLSVNVGQLISLCGQKKVRLVGSLDHNGDRPSS